MLVQEIKIKQTLTLYTVVHFFLQALAGVFSSPADPEMSPGLPCPRVVKAKAALSHMLPFPEPITN